MNQPSDFKGFVAISFAILLARVSTITGIEDHEPSAYRMGMLVLGACWLFYGMWNLIASRKG